LERIDVPTLVLWGADDGQLPLDDGFEYARRLRAQMRTIAGCGHLLIGERPDACAHAIEDFIATAGTRPSAPASAGSYRAAPAASNGTTSAPVASPGGD